MKYVLKLEPYTGDDSELSTLFWSHDESEEPYDEDNFEHGKPMWVIISIKDGKAEVDDYGYRTEEEAQAACRKYHK